MAAATPRVRLVLHHEGPQEQVLRSTAGHEVVETVLGNVALVFCRKRKEPPAPAPSAPRTARTQRPAASTLTQRASMYRTPAATRAVSAAAATALAAESPYADEVELPHAMGERLLDALRALPERAPPAERLLAFCASLGATAMEAASAGPSSGAGSGTAVVLADAFAAFQRSLAAALADGRVMLAGAAQAPATPADDGEVEQQPGYQVDLAARKAGLRARLANFQKEEEEWHSLLQKVEQLDQQQLMAAAAPGAAPAGAAPAGAAAPAAEQAAPGAAEADGLSSVATEAGTYDLQPEGEQQAPGGSEEDAELAALARLHAGLHRHVAMQVEGVCKLVGDVEELVDRANRAAAAVQAEYHAEKFRAFPHVNSPARLIKELVRLPGNKAQQLAAGAAADKAGAGGEQAAQGKENAAADMEVV